MEKQSKQNRFLINFIEDLIRQAYEFGCAVHTDFLDLHEQSVVLDFLKTVDAVFLFDGGYLTAERKQIVFLPDKQYPSDSLESISYLQIDIPKIGIKKKLTHRDYLGALMNLGIERKLMGDLLIQEDFSILVCNSTIAPYIIEHFRQVGNVSIDVSYANDYEQWQHYEPNYERIKTTVASNRLDSIIKNGIGMSRNDAASWIKAGRVFVNGREVVSSDYKVPEGAIISVRKKGKFRLSSIGHITKKGRLYIELDRYR